MKHRQLHARPLTWTAVLVTAATGAACGGTDPRQGPGEEAAQTQGAIVNGTNATQGMLDLYGIVALYHPDSQGIQQYWPRPCSAKILFARPSIAAVLTARHCVTTNEQIGGPVAAPSQLALIHSLNPGPANPNLPPGTIPATALVAMPVAGLTTVTTAEDLAIVYVGANNWPSMATGRLGIWVGGPARAYPGIDLAFGYGITVSDWNCGTDRSIVGAGTARWTEGFTRQSYVSDTAPADGAYLPWYGIFAQPSSANGTLICGDSGGPDFVTSEFDDNASVGQLVGVHSQANDAELFDTGPNLWLQTTLGGTLLGVMGTASTLSRPLNQHTVSLQASSSTSWIYNWNTAQIYDPSQEDVDEDWCLDLMGNTVVANLCNTTKPSQRWYPDAMTRIRSGNATTGNCLTAPTSGSTITVSACADLPTRQGWYFRVQ